MAALEAYVPGEQPTGLGWVKLNTNESPYPPGPAVIAALQVQLDGALARYPQPTAQDLRACAARRYGVPVERIFAGNGSDEVLRLLVAACVAPGATIAAADPGYGLYRILAQAHAASFHAVAYEDDFLPPPAECWPRAALCFLTHPNSPAGVATRPERVAELAERLAGLLVVDEAYADFAEHDCVALARERDDVVVVRTFSKSYALAGLRLGLAFAPPAIVRALDKLKDAYNVNRLALAAGVAALTDERWFVDQLARVRATRQRLTIELQRRGCFVWPSQANFVLARVGPEARSLQRALAAQRVLVRYIDHPRVADALRITVGSDSEIDRFLAAFDTVRDQVAVG
jgi:histidinol-phosphate aminotransferase